MIDTTDTTDTPADSASDIEALAAKPLPPLVFARDRRKYTRFLDPLHTGPGLQLFESPEHEALGDGLIFIDPSGKTFTQSAPNTNYFLTDGGQYLSYGQVMALAGDFYGVPSQPISDGAAASDQQARFLAAFNSLYSEKPVNGVYQAQQILQIMQQQSDTVTDSANQIMAQHPYTDDAWSQAYTAANSDNQFDKAYNFATGAVEATPWFMSQGRYLQLANVNWDHFGACAVACYLAGHAVACDTAAGGDYMRAYAMEAFACHFLTDLFSTGHLRTPRKALHTANPASDLCAQRMHDEDSYNGLVVHNQKGNTWIAYGDKRLNDPPNQLNYTMAQAAVTLSLNEVISALGSKNPSAPNAALNLIPNLDMATNAQDTANWSPLYVLDNTGAPLVRDTLSDLRCREWTSLFYYVSTYWRTPAGGVHSLAGAPPGRGVAPAHAMAWQSHRIIGSSEDDLAPSAAIVTNPDNGLGNTTPMSQFGNQNLGSDATPAMQNTLVAVFRKKSSDSSNHHLHYVAAPMTDAPAFKIYNSKDISFNGQSTHTTKGGDPAVVAQPGQLFMVYPDDSGVLHQATWSAATGTWTAPSNNTLFSGNDSKTYTLIQPVSDQASPRVALCNLASSVSSQVSSAGLYLAFPTANLLASGGNIALSASTTPGAFSTPHTFRYSAGNATVNPRTVLGVSLVEYQDSLLLAYADVTSGGAIRIAQSADGKNWTQLAGSVRSASGQPIWTASALSLVVYGGLLAVLVNDTNGNITAHTYLNSTGRWVDYTVQGTSNGSTGKAPLQSLYGWSALAWQNQAYVVFSDKANGAPSIMTTASSTAS
ncbi:hypothetical protein [Dyella sp.]|uniref:hypothetical protein n=1 Tax=Dyella sp. TaxID=1869338 RepID=UPI002ED21303